MWIVFLFYLATTYISPCQPQKHSSLALVKRPQFQYHERIVYKHGIYLSNINKITLQFEDDILWKRLNLYLFIDHWRFRELFRNRKLSYLCKFVTMHSVCCGHKIKGLMKQMARISKLVCDYSFDGKLVSYHVFKAKALQLSSVFLNE